MTYFNPRSYGLLIKDQCLLVSTEFYENTGRTFTKLPGGGLEIGEGPAEALERELLEELDIKASVGEIYAVNPKASQSVFDGSSVLSFYWRIDSWQGLIETGDKISHDIQSGWQVLNWVCFKELDPKSFSFESDQLVVEKLLLEVS
ncbi:MAG: NUDIX domain-containing protein [Candidatus Cloacimonetes bacterium]|nr:NUDIX domain-containing protein [Candidatus Cloacimonadota bacterium]